MKSGQRALFIYGKWKLPLLEKEKIDLLWWGIRLLDKLSEKEATKVLKTVRTTLIKAENPDLFYWFLRFSKDCNPFVLSPKIKREIKDLVVNYTEKLESLKEEGNEFEQYLIKEPLEVIKRYW